MAVENIDEFNDLGGKLRVGFDQREFLRRERPGFIQDRLRDRHLLHLQ